MTATPDPREVAAMADNDRAFVKEIASSGRLYSAMAAEMLAKDIAARGTLEESYG